MPFEVVRSGHSVGGPSLSPTEGHPAYVFAGFTEGETVPHRPGTWAAVTRKGHTATPLCHAKSDSGGRRAVACRPRRLDASP